MVVVDDTDVVDVDDAAREVVVDVVDLVGSASLTASESSEQAPDVAAPASKTTPSRSSTEEKFTRRVGEWLGRFMSWFLVEFNKNPLEDLGPKAVEMRERVGSTRRSRWPIAAVAGPAMSYLIRLATLRVRRRRGE